jgi:hypothetical protein
VPVESWDQDFDDFFGTLAPDLRASDRPMAMACFRLVTFLPLRPDFSVPFFLALISRSTDFDAFGLYFLPLDFLAELDFFAELFLLADFLTAAFLVALFLLALPFFALDFLAVDFLALDFLDGMLTFLHSHGKLVNLQKLSASLGRITAF